MKVMLNLRSFRTSLSPPLTLNGHLLPLHKHQCLQHLQHHFQLLQQPAPRHHCLWSLHHQCHLLSAAHCTLNQLFPGAHSLDRLSAETDRPTLEENTSHDDSVGPDNIEGYGAVQDLAEFLVSLRDHRLALSGEECIKIISLWQALGEYDKKKTIYPPRNQTNLKQGRFRATKKIVAPGVESSKRCFVGAHSPAQWPDCNRRPFSQGSVLSTQTRCAVME
ncbi:uncharacterized protein LOC128022785 [Carassius gibelio]|uniref:uncharacterized protein LOC128022739 n=1 Tax=Carassius gibelio TaxID=101364 RepID=UPI0022788E5A|nr:uncharacterized protein LOC128022739 [Carassius gibelio]XP_052466537.1 uncharacterized protein LOC128022785 [Carassius gibelio]